jgi:hypothetical protein
MGERVAIGTPNRTTNVDNLIAKSMHHHHMSIGEANFVAEMARAVGLTITYKVFARSRFRLSESLILVQ